MWHFIEQNDDARLALSTASLLIGKNCWYSSLYISQI